jgi:hypothetical protein
MRLVTEITPVLENNVVLVYRSVSENENELEKNDDKTNARELVKSLEFGNKGVTSCPCLVCEKLRVWEHVPERETRREGLNVEL